MNWEMKSLDQLGYISRGRSRHRPRDAAHLYDGPYPFIQTGDVKHAGLYVTDYKQTYSVAGLEQSRLWKAGTLCITIAANIADTAILAIDACFPDSVIGFIPESGNADVRFVKYIFDAHLQRTYKTFTQGAAQDNLSQSKLLSLKFPVPGFTEQQRIADILSTYDDLIENNRRRIALLEQAARQLYKEWFIHLRFPGHEHVKIKDGVPEGWERGRVGDIAEVKSGFAFKSRDWKEFGNPVIKIKNIVGDGSIDLCKCDCVDDSVAEGAVKFVIDPGDLLIAMTGATVGKIGLMPKSDRYYYLNQRVGRFISRTKESIEYFLFPLFLEENAQSQILNFAAGAAQPNISGGQLENISMTIPPRNIMSFYLDSV